MTALRHSSGQARIPFLSLVPGEDAADVRAAIDRVVARGWFVLGPEVEAFEREFAAASGAAHAVGVGNGTDAIALALRALGVGAGDEVITSPLSAAYTALAIVMAGARPVFVDIETERLTIDPARIEAAITPRTRAIVPVHLYGQAADMTAIARIANAHHLAVVEDCCQAHLATSNGRPVGTIGAAGTFSFYPTKNLGALGDGGAVITNDPALAERIKRLRNGGQSDRYKHQEIGINSRLDEMQAAILRVRLPRLGGWTAHRRALAARYRERLASAPVDLLPEIDPGHVYHLFVVRTQQRQDLQRHLSERGIETLVHYPMAIPNQPAMRALAPAECPVAVCACNEVLSLPLHQRLREADVDEVATAVKEIPCVL
jgi:dTDP-3-amino-3,4,6-trideoxy-alpha-D-glucose transaminase